jgi:hypothetical protein
MLNRDVEQVFSLRWKRKMAGVELSLEMIPDI